MVVECRGLRATKERWGPRRRNASVVPSYSSVVQHLAAHSGNGYDTVKRAEVLLVVDTQQGFAVRVFTNTTFVITRSLAFSTGAAFGVNSHAALTK